MQSESQKLFADMVRHRIKKDDQAAEIERLRAALATVRLFIEDEMIAHAVVVLEGADTRDPNNPSLLKLIDAALGNEQ